MIEHHSKKANKETLSVIHLKCYEGLKGMAINYISTMKQSQQLQSNILNEKLTMYKTSYTTLQAEVSQKHQENDTRERDLKNKVYMLEFKAKETQA